ncbi:MAG: electron transfer flavoprotein subunit beta/FixA family protein [Aigarchaeota archaeon]|nr:electron transfer flavoprotein subunit beta/FixA family protein [Candidatus Calditenuaceae archaeon]
MHVFVKQVPDVSTLEHDPSSLAPRLDRATLRLGESDIVALEAAVRIKEEFGGEVVVLSAGAELNELVLREALAAGADRCLYVSDPVLRLADSWVTSNVLSRLSKKAGDAEILFCGEASSDSGNYQLGPRLSEILSIPCVTHALKIELSGSVVRVKRALEDRVENLECDLPVIITASLELASPRLPSLLMIRAASRKPMTRVELSELGLQEDLIQPQVERLTVKLLKTSRRGVVLTGEPDACAVKLVEALEKEGVLRG